MPTADVYNGAGQKTGTVELPEGIFGIRPHRAVMHEVLVAQLAGRRLGTQSTKTRGEVSGSTRKLYRQKGTGRARHGSRKAPLFKGGGITFGPKPRSYAQATPRRVKRLGVRSALSAKAATGRIVLIEPETFDPPKTRALEALLAQLPVAGRTLLVTTPGDAVLVRLAANLPEVRVVRADSLNVHDIVTSESIVLTKPALAAVAEVLGP